MQNWVQPYLTFKHRRKVTVMTLLTNYSTFFFANVAKQARDMKESVFMFTSPLVVYVDVCQISDHIHVHVQVYPDSWGYDTELSHRG